jgi:hypothetical protein
LLFSPEALDEIRMYRGECADLEECNFEYGTLCFYKNQPSNSINWLVKKAQEYNTQQPTNTLSSIPFDHTFGNGNGQICYLGIIFAYSISK